VSVAGLVLILLPIAFNVAFGLLSARFDYPDVLRKPTHEVLARFREGGRSLVLLWWAFALTALALAPAVVLLSDAIGDADSTLLAVATVTGVLAALVQLLGLIRWPFLVPYLARVAAEPGASEARQEAVDIVFQAFNRYLGVAVGEHLGYLLTGAGRRSPASPSPRRSPRPHGSAWSASSSARCSRCARSSSWAAARRAGSSPSG
jgi:hypothetical protein